MESAPCPECGNEITLSNPRQGQRVACPNCGADLEVINRRPLELDWSYSEPEDDGQALGLEDDEWGEDWDDETLAGSEEDDEDWES